MSRCRILGGLLVVSMLGAGCGAPIVGGGDDVPTDLGVITDVPNFDVPNRDVPNRDVPDPVDARTCVAAIDCDDGVACTEDTCNPIGGCEHRPVDSMCPDDGIACTHEVCNLGRGCASIPRDNDCPNGQLCRTEGANLGCTPPPACNSPNDPRCDDGQPCTTDRCDMATGRCVFTTDDSMCSDGAFCNGAERCYAYRGCLGGTPPVCDDGTLCTIDQCNEDMDRCENSAENRLCDDGTFCNGAETCNPNMRGRGCVAAVAPRNCNDNNACTIDSCDEPGRQCRNTPRDVDMDGDPDQACGGGDCNDNNPRVNSRANEVCNMVDDNCNGTTDEGVASACGNCDLTCRSSQVGGMGGNPFSMSGSRGVSIDAMQGGLTVQAMNRTGDFLWIPNTGESTVSKWDANANPPVELARYNVGLAAGKCQNSCCYTNGCNMTSRVAVDGFGDLVVANRAFGMQGTVSKIAADRRDCIDRNMNGMIDTSTGPMNVLPFDQDECVLWTAPVGRVDAVLRMIAVDRGDALVPQGNIWVGSCNAAPFEVYKLDTRTGRVLNTLAAPQCAYGAIVLPNNVMWVSSLFGGGVYSVNTLTNAIGPLIPVNTPGGGGNYGITADPQSRLWFSYNGSGIGAYDPAMNTFSYANLGSSYGSGVTVDANGEIWSMRSDGGDLAHFPSTAFAAGAQVPAAMITHIAVPAPFVSGNQSAIGADRAGRLWMTRVNAGPVVRYDPNEPVAANRFTQYNGPNQVYTYTDFTGSVRRSVIGTGTHIEEFDGGCAAPNWDSLTFDSVTPPGTTLSFSFQTADTFAGLGAATAVQVAIAPANPSPASVRMALAAAMITPRRHSRVTVVFNPTAMPVASPVLRSMRLQWNCP